VRRADHPTRGLLPSVVCLSVIEGRHRVVGEDLVRWGFGALITEVTDY
jgi:hypothetical protein